MSIALCTDSSSLLSSSDAVSLGVDVVPIAVIVDGELFDEEASAIDDFYDRLHDGARATTSQPSPADFADAYDRAADRGARSVVSIHLDARVSGTVASAETAAREARLPVTVVDTGTVSFGVTVCVRAAAALVARGGSERDAAAEASRLGTLIENVFVAPTGPDGRVPRTSDWAVLRFADGEASVVGVGGSLADAVEQMARHVTDVEEQVSAAVGHAGAEMEQAADELAHELLRADGVATVERYRVGAPVGAHTGAESLGVFWWPSP